MKEIFRPMMVAYGHIRRSLSDGQFFTSQVEKMFDSIGRPGVIIIPDIRYSEYPKDEVWWLQNKHGGFLIHVERLINGVAIPAPNDDERRNDPIVKTKSDFLLTLPNFDVNCGDFSELQLETEITDYARSHLRRNPFADPF
jgi:hypothetical protein